MVDENKQPEQKLSPAERMKAENDLLEIEVKRKEDLDARMKMGGGTTGNIPAEKPKEKTPKEYADRVMHNQVK